jgi:hypothetical protein
MRNSKICAKCRSADTSGIGNGSCCTMTGSEWVELVARSLAFSAFTMGMFVAFAIALSS